MPSPNIETDRALTYARKLWPMGFTKREIETELGHPVSLRALQRMKAIENTRVKRKRGKWRDVIWRYKPYQLPLPLEEKSNAGA